MKNCFNLAQCGSKLFRIRKLHDSAFQKYRRLHPFGELRSNTRGPHEILDTGLHNFQLSFGGVCGLI